jgi:hypothetical protein
MKYDIWFQIMIRYELGSVQHHYNLQIDAKSVELLDWELWLLSTWIWNSSTDWFISWDILGSSEVVVVGFSDSYVFRIFFKVPKFWVSGWWESHAPKRLGRYMILGLFPPCFDDSRVVWNHLIASKTV